MNNEAAATETLTAWAKRNNVTREQLAAAVVMASAREMLANDAVVQAMFENNDRDHFLAGFNSPAMQSKIAAAFVTIRDIARAA